MEQAAVLDFLEQPLDCLFLQFDIFRSPEGVDGMSDGGEDHAPFPEVVRPARDGLHSMLLVPQSVNVLGLEQDVFRILVVFDVACCSSLTMKSLIPFVIG